MEGNWKGEVIFCEGEEWRMSLCVVMPVRGVD